MDTSLTINLPLDFVVEDTEEVNIGYWFLISDLSWQLGGIANVYTQQAPTPPESGGGAGRPPEILIKLSANATNALFALKEIFRIVRTYLIFDKKRELIFELDGRKLSLKGHSLQEELELIQQLFPESQDQSEFRPLKSLDNDFACQPTLERLQYLKQLYGVSEYESPTVAQIGQKLAWDDTVTDEVTRHLLEAGFIEVAASNTISITDAGRLALTYSIQYPNQMASYLQSGGININVQGDLNVGGDVVGRDKILSDSDISLGEN
jgi:hypothetical protein